MLAPSVQRQAFAAHNMAHGFELFGRWRGLRRFTKFWPAILVLWPEPVQNPREVTRGIALFSTALEPG